MWNYFIQALKFCFRFGLGFRYLNYLLLLPGGIISIEIMSLWWDLLLRWRDDLSPWMWRGVLCLLSIGDDWSLFDSVLESGLNKSGDKTVKLLFIDFWMFSLTSWRFHRNSVCGHIWKLCSRTHTCVRFSLADTMVTADSILPSTSFLRVPLRWSSY